MYLYFRDMILKIGHKQNHLLTIVYGITQNSRLYNWFHTKSDLLLFPLKTSVYAPNTASLKTKALRDHALYCLILADVMKNVNHHVEIDLKEEPALVKGGGKYSYENKEISELHLYSTNKIQTIISRPEMITP